MLPITVAFWDYDRTMPIADGRVAIGGCAPKFSVLRPQEIFVRALRDAEFDVCELSLSRYAQSVARGDNRYVGIPAYPSRAFRHASVYVRRDAGIAGPRDLKGRRFGIHNFDDTAAVVVRGMLRDEFGLAVGDIAWLAGRLIPEGTDPIEPVLLDPAVRLEYAPGGTTIEELALSGRIDGIIALLPPASFTAGDPRLQRLFPDHRAAEEDYFERTGLFPIMHLIAVRRELATEHPWLPGNLYDAFVRAKMIATSNLGILQTCKATLPWVVAEWERTRDLMGEDYWPYGVAANRQILAATLRYLAEEGLLARSLSVEELFAPEFAES